MSATQRVYEFIRSNVLGLIAIFIALAGTTYAATREAADGVPKGSITSAEIANRDIATSDLGPEAVTSSKIAQATIKGGDINWDKLDYSILQRRVAQSCDPGDSIRAIAADGTVTCQGGGGPPSGPAGGDLAGTYPNPSLADGSIDSSSLFSAGLLDGPAGTATLRSLGTGAAQAAAGDDPRLSDARTPTGAAGGDLSGSYPNPALGNGVVDPASFASLPGGKMIQTGVCQTFGNGGFPKIRFDGLQYGQGVSFDDGADTLTIETAGTYLVNVYAEWDANGTGDRALGYTASGTPGADGFDARPGSGTTDTQGEGVTQLVHLDPGTVLTGNAAQTISGGGDLQLQDLGANCASLSVQWLAP